MELVIDKLHSMCLCCLYRSSSKSQETLLGPNLTLAPLAYHREEPSPVHPRDSQAPGRGPTAISRPPQGLHNGDSQPAAKPALPSATNGVEEMDTDGEIDVDDCDDCEYCSSFTLLSATSETL